MINKIGLWALILIQIVCIPSLVRAEEANTFGGLREKVERTIPSGAQWSVSVVEMETGKRIVDEGNSKKPLVPGSLMKLFITGAVLDHSERHGGWDMKTLVLHDGVIEGKTVKGNIYMRGRGNPLLTASDMKNAAAGLWDNGIEEISGDIVLDDTLFDTVGLKRTRKGPAYAPASALGLDLHTVSVIVTPSLAGKAPEVRVEPPNDGVRFAVSARTAPVSSNSLSIGRIDDLSYKVTGEIAEGLAIISQRFALDYSALYTAGAFKTFLEKKGIRVKGNAGMGKAPERAVPIVEIESPSLDSLLRDMNVNSLNVVADNLLLLLGAERFGEPGTAEKGRRAVEEHLKGIDGLSERGTFHIAMFDGSGLDGRNRVTAGFMASYLYSVSRRSWFGRFKDTLPNAGEGTLKEISVSDASFRAKTGALENAFAVAGYCSGRDGKEYIFVYIANGPSADMAGIYRAGTEVIKTVIGSGAGKINP